ncbi:unnamed protein product [Ostreobium quekettii]|uniref:Uncharacterized protein n=1 Tax=Ostreobium quekettii TaxID=121088 RepID=A0A8S1IXP6_9CHLO|nr:unnamed protein product [Ostreobium quekettii]|eukprot:evm.model.scf_203.2 EVM.evm.TU.scf_203.2   scf_203:15822-19188(+)
MKRRRSQSEGPLADGASPPAPSGAQSAWIASLGVNEQIPAVDLRPAWAVSIHPCATLSLRKLNEKAEKRGNLGGRRICDPIEAFTSTHVLSLGEVLRLGLAAKARAQATKAGADAAGEDQAAKAALELIAPLIEATSGTFEFQVPRHLNALPEEGGEQGQRVIYYGVEGGRERGLRDLKRVLVDLAARGCLMDKNSVHTALEYPGGTPEQVLEGEGKQQGVTHGGRIALAWDASLDAAVALSESGQPITNPNLDPLSVLWYDQPAGYDRPTSDDSNYWAALSVFDPSLIDWGCGVGPDTATRRAWAENTEIWSALDILTVPFASDHPNPAYRDYKRNPAEIKRASELTGYANLVLTAANRGLGKRARAALKDLRNYAVYCEEGVVNVKNAGLNVVLNQRSVDEGRISEEAFAAFESMVEAFQSAPGWREAPAVGWEKLRERGVITKLQLEDLRHTGYVNQRLRTMDPDVRPWTHYCPGGVETDTSRDGCGLYTRPVTVATLAANFIANNYPRHELVKGFAGQMGGVMSKPAEHPARVALEMMIAQAGLSKGDVRGMAGLIAAEFHGAFLDLQTPYLFKQLRVPDMEGEGDRERVEAHFKEFRGVVVDPGLARDELVVRIKEINERFREVTYTLDGAEVRGIQLYSPLQGVEGPKGAPFMPPFVGHRHLAFLVGSAYRDTQGS